MLVLVPVQLEFDELEASLDLPAGLRGSTSWSHE